MNHEFLTNEDLHKMRQHVRQSYELKSLHNPEDIFQQFHNNLSNLVTDNVRLMQDIAAYQQEFRRMQHQLNSIRSGGRYS